VLAAALPVQSHELLARVAGYSPAVHRVLESGLLHSGEVLNNLSAKGELRRGRLDVPSVGCRLYRVPPACFHAVAVEAAACCACLANNTP
jgi:hypothetical protein